MASSEGDRCQRGEAGEGVMSTSPDCSYRGGGASDFSLSRLRSPLEREPLP